MRPAPVATTAASMKMPGWLGAGRGPKGMKAAEATAKANASTAATRAAGTAAIVAARGRRRSSPAVGEPPGSSAAGSWCGPAGGRSGSGRRWRPRRRRGPPSPRPRSRALPGRVLRPVPRRPRRRPADPRWGGRLPPPPPGRGSGEAEVHGDEAEAELPDPTLARSHTPGGSAVKNADGSLDTRSIGWRVMLTTRRSNGAEEGDVSGASSVCIASTCSGVQESNVTTSPTSTPRWSATASPRAISSGEPGAGRRPRTRRARSWSIPQCPSTEATRLRKPPASRGNSVTPESSAAAHAGEPAHLFGLFGGEVRFRHHDVEDVRLGEEPLGGGGRARRPTRVRSRSRQRRPRRAR